MLPRSCAGRRLQSYSGWRPGRRRAARSGLMGNSAAGPGIRAAGHMGRRTRTLLNDVNNFVRENLHATGAMRSILAGTKYDVGSEGEGTGVVLPCEIPGGRVRMQAES